MKAVTWQGRRDVRVEEVPDPVIKEPNDAIVKITSTGLCGSANRSSPRSFNGLKTTIGTPRLWHSASGRRNRGLFTPGFWPK